MLRVDNVGSQPATGTTTVTDTLPAGLTYVDGDRLGLELRRRRPGRHLHPDARDRRRAPTRRRSRSRSTVGPAAYPVGHEHRRRLRTTRTATTPTTRPPTRRRSPRATSRSSKTHLGSLQVNARASYVIDVDNVGTADTNRTGDRHRHASGRPHLRRLPQPATGTARPPARSSPASTTARSPPATTPRRWSCGRTSRSRAATQVTNTATVALDERPGLGEQLRRRHRRRRPHRRSRSTRATRATSRAAARAATRSTSRTRAPTRPRAPRGSTDALPAGPQLRGRLRRPAGAARSPRAPSSARTPARSRPGAAAGPITLNVDVVAVGRRAGHQHRHRRHRATSDADRRLRQPTRPPRTPSQDVAGSIRAQVPARRLLPGRRANGTYNVDRPQQRRRAR